MPTSQPPADGPSINGLDKPSRTPHELRILLNELGLKAGRVGLNVPTLVVELGEHEKRLRRSLNSLDFVKRNGNYIHPEGVAS